MIMYAMWAGFLVFVMVSTTESFFCPALAHLSQFMRLSPNVAVCLTLRAPCHRSIGQ